MASTTSHMPFTSRCRRRPRSVRPLPIQPPPLPSTRALAFPHLECLAARHKGCTQMRPVLVTHACSLEPIAAPDPRARPGRSGRQELSVPTPRYSPVPTSCRTRWARFFTCGRWLPAEVVTHSGVSDRGCCRVRRRADTEPGVPLGEPPCDAADGGQPHARLLHARHRVCPVRSPGPRNACRAARSPCTHACMHARCACEGSPQARSGPHGTGSLRLQGCATCNRAPVEVPQWWSPHTIPVSTREHTP